MLVYDSSALKAMREAGLRLTEVIHALRERIQPGVTGLELDQYAEQAILRTGAEPSFKGYQGYPATICLSVDDVVIHGIPNKKPLLPGQLVSVDLGLVYNGWHSDAAFSVTLAPAEESKLKLMDVTLQALKAGVAKVAPGVRLGDVSSEIQRVAESAGYGIVKDFTGHGIGRALHEEPPVPNFGRRNSGPILKPYQFLAIEPMVTEGSGCVIIDGDGWTVRTCEGVAAAHFEYTVAVTEQGVEVLTPHV